MLKSLNRLYNDRLAKTWTDELHPRSSDGKFSSGGGSENRTSEEKTGRVENRVFITSGAEKYGKDFVESTKSGINNAISMMPKAYLEGANITVPAPNELFAIGVSGQATGAYEVVRGNIHISVDSALPLNTMIHETGHHIWFGNSGIPKEDIAIMRVKFEEYSKSQGVKVSPASSALNKRISEYAWRNEREHFAENFVAYMKYPNKLKKVEPEAYVILNNTLKRYKSPKIVIGGYA